MGLTLGVYNKNNHIRNRDYKEVLDKFSIEGIRNLNIKKSRKSFFACMKDNNLKSFLFENKDIIAVFAGEVYGNKNISKKSYENYIKNLIINIFKNNTLALNEINGNFSIAIYDKKKGTLNLINDSFGIYPLFIYENEDLVVFCNEFQPLVEVESYNLEINYDAIAEYFIFKAPLSGKTFFKEIKNLSPASFIQYNHSNVSSLCYDNINESICKNKNITEHAKDVSIIFERAVQNRVNLPGNIESDLSGGSDTRLILSNLDKKQRNKITFRTLSDPRLKNTKNRDLLIAKQIVNKLGLKHKIIRKETINLDQLITSEIRIFKSPDVRHISGTCGGEFLGADCFNAYPIDLFNISKKQIHYFMNKLFTKEFISKISDPYESLIDELNSIKSENKEFLFLINMFTRSFISIFYTSANNRWIYPHSYPTVTSSPFCDKLLLKKLLQVPMKYLSNYQLYDTIYSKNFTELTKIPTNSPLATKGKSIKLINVGVEPKSLQYKYHNKLLFKFINDDKIWAKNFFTKKNIIKLINSSKPSFKSRLMFLIFYLEYNIPLINKIIRFIKKNKLNRLSKLKKYNEIQANYSSIISSFVVFEVWYRKNIR